MDTQTEPAEVSYEKGKLYSLEISKLQADPWQPRKYFDEAALQELTESVKKHGVLQPLLFRREPSGELFIVVGERRYLAAIKAGLSSLPALFVEGLASEIALVENLLRENLTAVEEAEALRRIIDVHGYCQKDLCKALGKAQSTISEILSINRVSKEILEDCRQNPKCPRSILVEIAKKETPKDMLSLYNRYKKQGLVDGTPKEGQKRTSVVQEKADRAISSIQKLTKALAEVNGAHLSAGKKEELRAQLGGLKAVLDEMLVNLVA